MLPPRDETEDCLHPPPTDDEVDAAQEDADAVAAAAADLASALDADIQQRADFVKEALRIESNNRSTTRSIVHFLYPHPVVQSISPGYAPEYHPPADTIESDPRAEEARVQTRVAAYERLERIFASDLPSRQLTAEFVEAARWAAFSVPRDAEFGEAE